MKTHIGRFELKRLLGQGAQAQVWLAFDPRLEREVAIKHMKPAPKHALFAVDQWLQEARSVSRLTHPHIVPVFEADVHEQRPYMVFEYVPGQTLAQRLAAQGAIPATQAVPIVQDVLSALVAAHADGVVHRDLKPSNVLLDAHGRARVMDFGIAARMARAPGDAKQPDAAGSPGYMAPEAVRGEAISPLMDVYGAGLLLAELLWGRPLRTGRDVTRVLQQTAAEPLQLPAQLLEGLDDALRAIVLRATAFDPAQRHVGAQPFLDALLKWSGAHRDTASEEAATGARQNSTLDFLLRRMRNKTDFPALSESIGKIQRMAMSDTESISSVTNEILKDVALTNKLLRLVNSAHYARGDSIGTVSRAVVLVGFNGIRNMALSLVLLEHMQDKGNAHLLKEEFLRALMAGSIASELGPTPKEGEEAFIGALFQNLGRMLSQFYFPEEADNIRKLVASPREPINEELAATRVLGIGFEALGLGIAKAWGLPEGIQRCIVRPPGAAPGRVPDDGLERLRWRSRAANEMADAMLQTDAQEVDRRLGQSAQIYQKSLGLNVDEMLAATLTARKRLVELAQAMDISVRPNSRAAQLLQGADAAPEHVLAISTGAQDALAATELQATQKLLVSPSSEQPGKEPVSQTLAAGIQDITNAMVEEFKLSDVLRMILETMFRALEFHRIVFCMREPKSDMLTGRFGLGTGVEGVVRQFRVPMGQVGGQPDLFATICAKGADTLISDASAPRIAERLPDWYRKAAGAPTFLILPLLLKGRAFGMIYADKAELGSLVVDEKELAMLRTLRNQAVMAFRQSSG
ncbi:serine/threonine protein kinase [Simplicispira suum]|uniref:Serine/threonine protein kinase n=1 Tax=Simplicispira suum TaxID=2109915 RepID=A0A2S0MW89_9BURK|nr:serine/threonine protein kinase [Simplicispira suum]AVO40160.1 serine/threonine protein kinase [Simplicispira suum]